MGWRCLSLLFFRMISKTGSSCSLDEFLSLRYCCLVGPDSLCFLLVVCTKRCVILLRRGEKDLGSALFRSSRSSSLRTLYPLLVASKQVSRPRSSSGSS